MWKFSKIEKHQQFVVSFLRISPNQHDNDDDDDNDDEEREKKVWKTFQVGK